MILIFAASHDLLARLSHVWGYVSLGASSVVAEEAAPVLAGFAAHQGHIHVLRALLACAAGSWLADVALYAFGRTRAVSALSRWRWLAVPAENLIGAVRRHPWRGSLATRFAYGARLVLPITCGAARVGPGTFLVGSCASTLAWSGIFIGTGWAFGQTAVVVVEHLRRHEDLVALLLVMGVSVGVWLFTRRNTQRMADKIGGPDGGAAIHAPTRAHGVLADDGDSRSP